MRNDSDKVPVRFNGLNWEIRKDFLSGIPQIDHETSYAIGEAMSFAGGKGMYVNLDRILNSVGSAMGRTVAGQIRDALTGDELDLPRLAIAGDPIAAKIAKYRLENLGPTASVGGGQSRSTVIPDDARVVLISSRRRL